MPFTLRYIMGDTLHRWYLRFRSPRCFLIVLSTFIVTSLLLHHFRGYDADWGGTNLTLSIEASVASAVITVAAEETIMLLRKILDIVHKIDTVSAEHRQILVVLQDLAQRQERTLHGVLLIAEAQRDALVALQEKQDEPGKRKSAVQRKRTEAN